MAIQGQHLHVDAAMSSAIRRAAEQHMDAAASVFFERELMQVLGRTYDYKYPDLMGRRLCPVSHEIGPGATVLNYKQYNRVGRAAVIKDFSDDLPEVQVMGKEFFVAFKNLGDSYGYSVDEVAAAVLAAQNGAPGPSLEQRRAIAARDVIEFGIDDIIAQGDTDSGMTGMLNAPNALTYVVAPGQTGNSTAWSTKTGSEILNDLIGVSNFIVEQTNDVEKPDTVVVPVQQYGLLTKPLQTGSPVTVAQHFLANNPYIKSIEKWSRTKGIGVGGTDRMVCYRRDSMALECHISREFEQMPPQLKNLKWMVACHAKTAGVAVYYPRSMAYADGI